MHGNSPVFYMWLSYPFRVRQVEREHIGPRAAGGEVKQSSFFFWFSDVMRGGRRSCLINLFLIHSRLIFKCFFGIKLVGFKWLLFVLSGWVKKMHF